MTASAQDVERTARDTTIAQWGVASVVMVGSAAAGYVAFEHLGEFGVLGVITAGAVDLALAAWLTTAKRLRASVGRSTPGVVLEVVTAAMTLYLNLGAAVFNGIDQKSTGAHWLLGIAHGFLPVVLILVIIAFGDAQLKLLHLRRDREAAEQAERDAAVAAERETAEAHQRERREIERRRAEGVLVEAQDYLRKAQELREQAEAETSEATRLREQAQAERSAIENEAMVAKQAADQLARQQRRAAASEPGKKPATAEQRRQWVREQRGAGLDPTGVDVEQKFPGAPRNGARIVREVIEAEHAEVNARRASVHAVKGE
jgi:hypothetical protein